MSINDSNLDSEDIDDFMVGDGVDYSEHFNVGDLTFDTVDNAFIHADSIALKLNFHLVRSSNHRDEKTGLIRNYVSCDRYGIFKSKANTNSVTPRRNTSTKKCSCKFKIKIVESKYGGKFAIKPHFGFHNHLFGPYLSGHWRRAALSPAHKEFAIAQLRAGVPPQNVDAALIELVKKHNEEKTEGEDMVYEPNRKAIYNLSSRMSQEDRGERNRAQQMLFMAKEANYVFHIVQDNVSNQLSHIFMCHPEALKMFRAWPYVVIIDSTYKTNVYNMPLMEMIGVSPVGKNFLIGYALMKDETVESYEWMLLQLKGLLLGGIVPEVIVTDRELGLLAAIPKVFPDTPHLLCTFHIYNAIEAYALRMSEFDSQFAKILTYGGFRKIVNAPTVVDCAKAWDDFKISYRHWDRFLEYLDHTWIVHLQKWARCFTDQYLHFRNTATSRVESAHAVLKKWVHSSTVGLDSLWARGHTMMVVQHSMLRKILSDSFGKSLNLGGAHARLFSLMSGKVSHLAVKYMIKEYDRGTKLGIGLQRCCGCWMTSTRGLPCACRLHKLHDEGRRVHVRDIHLFWRTLIYDGGQILGTSVDDVEELLTRIRSLDPSLVRGVIDVLDRHLHPEQEDVEEPAIIDNPRGRPRNSTTRNLSSVEHARRRIPASQRTSTPSSQGTSTPSSQRTSAPSSQCTSAPGSSVSYDTGPSAPIEMNFILGSSTDPVARLLPPWFLQYYDSYFNPAADGHCGFRCLSHAVHGVDINWIGMRRRLLDEIGRRPGYPYLYGDGWLGARARIFFPHNSGCGPAHWMHNDDLFGFATMCGWAICVIATRFVRGRRVWEGSATYLPVTAPEMVTAPHGILWLVHDGVHWMRIRVHGNPPIPPISILWDGYTDEGDTVHDDSVATWKTPYTARVRTWIAHVRGPADTVPIVV